MKKCDLLRPEIIWNAGSIHEINTVLGFNHQLIITPSLKHNNLLERDIGPACLSYFGICFLLPETYMGSILTAVCVEVLKGGESYKSRGDHPFLPLPTQLPANA